MISLPDRAGSGDVTLSPMTPEERKLFDNRQAFVKEFKRLADHAAEMFPEEYLADDAPIIDVTLNLLRELGLRRHLDREARGGWKNMITETEAAAELARLQRHQMTDEEQWWFDKLLRLRAYAKGWYGNPLLQPATSVLHAHRTARVEAMRAEERKPHHGIALVRPRRPGFDHKEIGTE